jgi:hypothetical protein
MQVSAVFIQESIIMLIIFAYDCMPLVRLIVNGGERQAVIHLASIA